MISLTQMTKYLRQAEAGIHQDGWGHPPFLAWVQQQRGRPVLNSPLVRLESRDGLAAFSQMVEARAEVVSGMLATYPRLIALVYCDETRSPHSLSDVRSFTAVDIWGRVFTLYRERGFEAFSQDDPLALEGDPVCIALARMLCPLAKGQSGTTPGALKRLLAALI